MRPRSASRAALLALLALLLTATTALPAAAQEPVPETDEEKTLYFIGVLLGKNAVYRFSPRPEEIPMIQAGLLAALEDREMALDENVYGPMLNELANARMAEAVEREKAAGKAFREEFAKQSGAVTTDSGLVFIELEAGEGDSPTIESEVKAHYEGSLSDGSVFDSSRARGRPGEFRLNAVVKCWQEAIPRMKEGGKAKFACPSDIGYGDRGMPPNIPGGATLVFEVELIGIN
ncbi:MAG: FKBP-type peptidyl-prolyl cis-trans isomerase [Myxococcota bacterium]